MNLSQLEVFVAIVESGSLKDAAEQVGLTHSAVSHSLSRLEAELGVTLLERNRGGVTLTRVGEVILQHAVTILSEAEGIRQQANRERGLSEGKIRFACVPQVPSRVITGIIRDFKHQYPEIEVVLFQGREHEIIDWLENQIVDVGTVVVSDDYPLTVKFLEGNVCVILPAEHRLASQAKINLQDLGDETLIGTRRELEATNAIMPTGAFSNLQLQHQVTETQTVVAMVAEGMGIAILPQMLFDDISEEKVISKLLHPNVFMRAFLVANVKSAMTEAFLEIAQEWSISHGYLSANA